MLSNVIGQLVAKQLLYHATLNQRLAHAYLITGEAGLGAEALAIELAKWMLCQQPDRDAFEPCQVCPNCRKVAGFQHVDVHYYFPTLKSTSESEIREMLEFQSQDAYAVARVGGGSIHIGDPTNPERDSIRGLIRDMSLRSFEGRSKVFILTFCEEMNAEAANALLKILEEPPPQSLFILTSVRPQQLLPTIVSRCQVIKLQPIAEVAMAEALVRTRSLEPGEARMAAKLSNGNYGRALQLVSGELHKRREAMLDFLRAALMPQASDLAVTVEALVSDVDRDKAVVGDMLVLLIGWFQDIVYVANLSESTAYVINADKLDRIQKFLRSFPGANIEKSISEVEKAVDLLSRNVYLNLILLNLGLNLRRFISSGRSI